MTIKTKKRFAAGVLVLSLAASLLSGNEADAASVKISRKKLTLTKGTRYKLKITGISGKTRWKSSNKKVAPVTKKGTVTAKRSGTAKITATVKSKKFTCKVTVRKKTVSQRPISSQKPETSSRPTVTQRPAATQKPTSSPNQTPVQTAAPSVSGTVTEETAYSILNSLRSTYPEGMPLTNSYYYYSPRFGNGYGCYGFAAKLSDTVFGTEKSYQTHSSFDQIKVGDHIRIGSSHSVIVLTKQSSYVTVVEGNYNSSVHWDRKITSASLASSGFKVYTRYQAIVPVYFHRNIFAAGSRAGGVLCQRNSLFFRAGIGKRSVSDALPGKTENYKKVFDGISGIL